MTAILEGFTFDLDRTLNAVVSVSAVIPDTALTAAVLGTERRGYGTLIDTDGLVLTIGYLVAEATEIWITCANDHVLPGYVVGYDYETGIGLVRTTLPVPAVPIDMGVSGALAVGEPVLVAGQGGRDQTVVATVRARREFAGYWEYVLDEAIFTAPAHPNWGGAALLGGDGRLYGIGSLLVQHVDEDGDTGNANMFVPADLLKPIREDLCRFGMRRGPARPWLGMFVHEVNGCLAVSGMYPRGPAAQAGLEPGDIITAVDEESVTGLAELFRRIWSLGEAGVVVPLAIVRGNTIRTIAVPSVDRNRLMQGASIH
ncbi:MAG: serine protease [Gammaproteobacteria bacterium]|nr:serine protease [Gammaproteobacteria bacterium]